jgi:hypothetical protein
MKKKLHLTFALGMLVVLLASATSAYAAPDTGKGGNNGTKGKSSSAGTGLVATTATGTLTDAEIADLVYMREEEKLARDVYLTLYDMWGLQTFSSIAASEQAHTDSIKGLLDAYGIADPVVNDTVGVFTNPDLQALYSQLVATGSTSLVDALKVGAAIEEIDIADLYESMAETVQPNILQVYSRLLSGSENHLRSFVSALSAQGVDYAPQYLSADTYSAIIGSAMNTQSTYGSQGQGQGGRGKR